MALKAAGPMQDVFQPENPETSEILETALQDPQTMGVPKIQGSSDYAEANSWTSVLLMGALI